MVHWLKRQKKGSNNHVVLCVVVTERIQLSENKTLQINNNGNCKNSMS